MTKERYGRIPTLHPKFLLCTSRSHFSGTTLPLGSILRFRLSPCLCVLTQACSILAGLIASHLRVPSAWAGNPFLMILCK